MRRTLVALSLLLSSPALAQTHVYPPLPASAADFTAHLADTEDAHDASAISVTAIIGLVATNVQAAIAELHSAIGSLTSSLAALAGTTAPTWTVNSDASGMLPEAASLVIRASTGAAVLPWTLSATAGGLVALWPDVGGASLGGTLVLGPPGDFLAAGDDVDQTLLLRGHQAGDAVGTPTTASIALDASADLLVLTPPTGGGTSFAFGDIAVAALALVDGRDVSVDGALLDGLYGLATADHQVLLSDGADAWQALTIAEDRVLGRLTGGGVTGLTGANLLTLQGLDATATGGGAALIGADATGRTYATGATVDAQLDAVDTALGSVSGTPAPVHLGHWGNEFNFEQLATESVQYAGATYQWTTDNHSKCFGWPRTRLLAAWSHGWHVELIVAIATADADTPVAFDCKNRAGTDYCTEWTASSGWTGGLAIQQRVITLTGDLPAGDDILCVAFHSDGTDIVRLHMADIYAYPLPAP